MFSIVLKMRFASVLVQGKVEASWIFCDGLPVGALYP